MERPWHLLLQVSGLLPHPSLFRFQPSSLSPFPTPVSGLLPSSLSSQVSSFSPPLSSLSPLRVLRHRSEDSDEFIRFLPKGLGGGGGLATILFE